MARPYILAHATLRRVNDPIVPAALHLPAGIRPQAAEHTAATAPRMPLTEAAARQEMLVTYT